MVIWRRRIQKWWKNPKFLRFSRDFLVLFGFVFINRLKFIINHVTTCLKNLNHLVFFLVYFLHRKNFWKPTNFWKNIRFSIEIFSKIDGGLVLRDHQGYQYENEHNTKNFNWVIQSWSHLSLQNKDMYSINATDNILLKN